MWQRLPRAIKVQADMNFSKYETEGRGANRRSSHPTSTLMWDASQDLSGSSHMAIHLFTYLQDIPSSDVLPGSKYTHVNTHTLLFMSALGGWQCPLLLD